MVVQTFIKEQNISVLHSTPSYSESSYTGGCSLSNWTKSRSPRFLHFWLVGCYLLRGGAGLCRFTRRDWWGGLRCCCSITDRLLGFLLPLLHRGQVLLQQAAVCTVQTFATSSEATVNGAHCSYRLQRVGCPTAQEAVLLRCLLLSCRLEARVWEGGVCAGCNRRGSLTWCRRRGLSCGYSLRYVSQLLLHWLLPQLHRLELQGQGIINVNDMKSNTEKLHLIINEKWAVLSVVMINRQSLTSFQRNLTASSWTSLCNFSSSYCFWTLQIHHCTISYFKY